MLRENVSQHQACICSISESCYIREGMDKAAITKEEKGGEEEYSE